VARGDVVTYRRLHDALRELLPPSRR
jgi:hypothetical protein